MDCQWSPWSPYSVCSKTCDGGAKRRIRYKVVEEYNGGICDGSDENIIPCNNQKCPLPPIDCQWSQWSSYSSCSKSCGGGLKRRIRHKVVVESNGGVCKGSNENTMSCNNQKCLLPPIDCQWSPWSPYSSCSKSCGGGAKQRIRYKVVQESNGGTCHGSNEDTIDCNKLKCPGQTGNLLSLEISFLDF